MKTLTTRYLIRRTDAGRVSIHRETPPTRGQFAIELRLDLVNHSPTGFEFGYGGSGPAQSALAILADFLEDDDRALRWYQAFKSRFIALIPRDQKLTEITGEHITAWLEAN